MKPDKDEKDLLCPFHSSYCEVVYLIMNDSQYVRCRIHTVSMPIEEWNRRTPSVSVPSERDLRKVIQILKILNSKILLRQGHTDGSEWAVESAIIFLNSMITGGDKKEAR